MDGVRVSTACLLLKLSFNLFTVQGSRCPPCPEGYFIEKNCSLAQTWSEGVRCKRCTNCSATNQETLTECFMYSDSLCGNKTSSIEVAEFCHWFSSCCSVCASPRCSAETARKNLNGGGSAPPLLKIFS